MNLSISLFNNIVTPSHFTFFGFNTPLEKRIEEISKLALTSLTPQHYQDMKEAFRLSRQWTCLNSRFSALLSAMPLETIKSFFLEWMTQEKLSNVDSQLQLYFSSLNETILLHLAGFCTVDKANAIYQAKALAQHAALNTGLDKKKNSFLKEFWIEFKFFVFQLLDTLIAICGINEFQRQKADRFDRYDTSYRVHTRFENFLKIAGYPLVIFAWIYTQIQYRSAAMVLTTVLVAGSIVTLIIYNRYLKPCPIDCGGLKNLTIELLKETHPVYPRRDILKKIEAAFQAKKGVILIGEPGAGKSWIIRSLTEQLSTKEICPFINSPQVFSSNASYFTHGGIDGISFDTVEDTFKKYSDEVVFFLDEFHSLFKETGVIEKTSIDEIKTFCEKFKYVIGATTIKEFEAHIKGKTAIVDRRFQVIQVGRMNDEQIKMSLSQYLESLYSEIEFDPQVLDVIVSQASVFNPNTALIDAAHSLLNRALQKMKDCTHSQLIEQKVTLQDRIGMLEQDIIHLCESGSVEKVIGELAKTKETLEKIENELNEKQQRILKMQKMESHRSTLRKESYRLAQPGMNLTKDSALARQWMMLHARIMIISHFIKAERAQLQLPITLNAQLIDTILNEQTTSTATLARSAS